MSTCKRAPTELANSVTPAKTTTTVRPKTTTAARYAPSTPHAIRALQVRSGLKTRSAMRSMRHRTFGDVMSTNNKTNSNNTQVTTASNDSVVRPDSARGILRRLAKLTAPTSKRVVATPSTGNMGSRKGRGWGDDKENARPDFYDDDGVRTKKPRLTLDIEYSLGEEEDLQPPDVGDDEDEDSELPVAPTPSILPDDDDEEMQNRWRGDGNGDPTITFRSIDFSKHSRPSLEGGGRRVSRLPFPSSEPVGGPDDAEDGPTILSEYGRRAISEEPTGRLSRYSFGSIRMDDFGSELEIRQESDQQQDKAKAMGVLNDYAGVGVDDQEDTSFDYGEETEGLRNLQRSPTLPPPDESTMNIPALDESFQLELPDQEAVAQHANPDAQPRVSLYDPPTEVRENVVEDDEPGTVVSQQQDQAVANIAPVRTSATRRKRLKATRHGTIVPSLPSSLIKRVAVQAQARLGNRKPKLGSDHMKALEQATEWFFEQVGEDLEAYSDHARRKKRVDASDMLMLMQRQRLLKGEGKLSKAAKEILPKDALAELDIPDEL
ncbi:uncharacterized protein A1O9_08137 [Exophiala aquamarina CBS 119918]|uniref:CENP-T/Histone H4 histone fold domain-containing protein n=1 Tax=Exophiala aquamarina CBS 119918 TaxID=1182545 RepID=A0A072P6P2_9EURO|nr:uncharacterized protein A1O9_08137 [Exophiala aquamarina CBS 119918]KEF55387.1 hypothetical protein A1O9_08137 [Exophiala aquamarina CBS 119918]